MKPLLERGGAGGWLPLKSFLIWPVPDKCVIHHVCQKFVHFLFCSFYCFKKEKGGKKSGRSLRGALVVDASRCNNVVDTTSYNLSESGQIPYPRVRLSVPTAYLSQHLWISHFNWLMLHAYLYLISIICALEHSQDLFYDFRTQIPFAFIYFGNKFMAKHPEVLHNKTIQEEKHIWETWEEK